MLIVQTFLRYSPSKKFAHVIYKSSCLPEDVDQLFALIKAFLKGKLEWEFPAEVATYLHHQLRPGAEAKGEIMHSACMRGIRGFSSWLAPLGVAAGLI